MSEEDEKERQRERDRREWLGEPIEHGGGYRPPRSRFDPDIGCCAVEAAGAIGVLAALVAAPAWFLIG